MQGGVDAHVGVAAFPVEFRRDRIAHRQRGRVRFGQVDDGVWPSPWRVSITRTVTPSARHRCRCRRVCPPPRG